VYKALELKETVPFQVMVPAPGLLGGKEHFTPRYKNIFMTDKQCTNFKYLIKIQKEVQD
jgi:hypothetical protein